MPAGTVFITLAAVCLADVKIGIETIDVSTYWEEFPFCSMLWNNTEDEDNSKRDL
jgi:hypothetical protein